MDGHRHVDAVTDPLDREIESMLAVDPSPEFLARVRTRVAEEPDPRAWRWRWTFAFAGVAAAMIVAVVVWQSGQQAPSSEVPVQLPQVAEAVVPPAPVAVEVERPRAPRPRRAPQATTAAAVERLVPVVNEEDAKAFDALLATIRGGEVVLTFNESSDSALAASALAIAPIAIDPLPDVLEGGVE